MPVHARASRVRPMCLTAACKWRDGHAHLPLMQHLRPMVYQELADLYEIAPHSILHKATQLRSQPPFTFIYFAFCRICSRSEGNYSCNWRTSRGVRLNRSVTLTSDPCSSSHSVTL